MSETQPEPISMAHPNPPHHGGNLQDAIARYGIPRHQWLDLSTGISPFPWPVPNLPAEIWQRLPEASNELQQAAQEYYGASGLAVPGSQWAIQQLPALFTPRRVWIAAACYEEYRYWWQAHGHQIQTCAELPAADDLQERDVVIVVNPNNPTAHYSDPDKLRQLEIQLRAKNGWLIVDEAFMDATPALSLVSTLDQNPQMIVLRSMGKFFGLAGIRMGFVFANPHLRQQLQQRLGPWAINHPAQYIATQALQDQHWHIQAIEQLQTCSTQLQQILRSCFPTQTLTATPLFVSVISDPDSVRYWHDNLAKQGIWTRYFPHWNRLRVGLADATGLQRFEQALNNGNR